jgi:hypothetical protein
MVGGLRRMRDKRREERELEREREAKESKAAEIAKLDKDKKRKPEVNAEKRPSDGTIKAQLKRDRSEPVAARGAEADSDSVVTPSAAGSSTTH